MAEVILNPSPNKPQLGFGDSGETYLYKQVQEMDHILKTVKSDVEYLKHQPWKEVIYQNGWSTASGVHLRYTKHGSIGILYGWITKSPVDNSIIGNIAEGYRPINTQRFKITVGGTSAIQQAEPTLNVSKTGDINLVNTGTITTNILVINIMFPIE